MILKQRKASLFHVSNLKGESHTKPPSLSPSSEVLLPLRFEAGLSFITFARPPSPQRWPKSGGGRKKKLSGKRMVEKETFDDGLPTKLVQSRKNFHLWGTRRISPPNGKRRRNVCCCCCCVLRFLLQRLQPGKGGRGRKKCGLGKRREGAWLLCDPGLLVMAWRHGGG